MHYRGRGFTLVELIGVIALAAILAAVAIPRLFNASAFEARGYEDAARAFLRYAQKRAIARRGPVYAHVTPDGLTLCAAAAAPCAQPLVGPDGQAPYAITLPGGVTQSPSAAVLGFDAQGRPDAALNLSITGETTQVVRVETETGYVH